MKFTRKLELMTVLSKMEMHNRQSADFMGVDWRDCESLVDMGVVTRRNDPDGTSYELNGDGLSLLNKLAEFLDFEDLHLWLEGEE